MKNILILSMMLLLPATGFSKNYESSFIEDMPEVSVSEVHPRMLTWAKDDVNLLSYRSLYIPQPVVFLSEKNKYKGIEADQMKLYADRVRAMFASRFGDLINIVDTPRADALQLNIGITELIMKKKRSLLGFTPVGALVHAGTSNNKIEDLEKLADKIEMKGANLELAYYESVTGELVLVRIFEISGKEKGREEESWTALRKEIEAIVDFFYTSYEAALANAGPAN